MKSNTNKLYTIIWFKLTFSIKSYFYIFTHGSRPLKFVDLFAYLGSNISSIERDVNILLAKALNAIDYLSITWNSALSDQIEWDFFQAVIVLILLFGCTTNKMH